MSETALTPREIQFGGDAYAGDVPAEGVARFADMDYYRNKIREFQQHLNSLAAIRAQMLNLAETSIDAETSYAAGAWLADLDANRSALLLSAEAVNAAAQSINAFGGRMPVLSVPQSLAALPAVAIAAVAGAVAGTAWAIAYAIDKGTEAQAIAARYRMIENLPADQQAVALAAEQNIERARAAADSPLGSIANVVKWGALAVAAWFGYRAFREFTTRPQGAG